MESRNLALSLLSLVVLASACAHTGGTDTGQESSRAIAVNDFSVTPQEIYEGTSVRVAVDVENTGNLPASVNLGSQGDEVLQDYCPDIFSIGENGFSVTTSGDRNGNIVRLEAGDRLNLRWQLSQEGDVPLYGYRCTPEAAMAFNYSVQAYRQLQIKRNREVEGSPTLRWESSSGPMRFAIETVGGTQQRSSSFIVPQDSSRSVNILLQLQNTQGEDYDSGVVNVIEESLAIKATEPLQLDEGYDQVEADIEGEASGPAGSGSGTISNGGQNTFASAPLDGEGSLTGAATAVEGMELEWKTYGYDGKKCDLQSGEDIRMFEGESRVISCSVELPSEVSAPSVISTVFGQVNYTYVKDLGSRSIRVNPRGQ